MVEILQGQITITKIFYICNHRILVDFSKTTLESSLLLNYLQVEIASVPIIVNERLLIIINVLTHCRSHQNKGLKIFFKGNRQKERYMYK